MNWKLLHVLDIIHRFKDVNSARWNSDHIFWPSNLKKTDMKFHSVFLKKIINSDREKEEKSKYAYVLFLFIYTLFQIVKHTSETSDTYLKMKEFSRFLHCIIAKAVCHHIICPETQTKVHQVVHLWFSLNKFLHICVRCITKSNRTDTYVHLLNQDHRVGADEIYNSSTSSN